MTFSDDLKRFTVKVESRYNTVFPAIVDLAHDSIQNGSAITGSPGQQVDTGALKASWQKQFESPLVALISTNKEYAIQEEEGVTESGTPIVQKSQVGGPHSTKLTVANFDRIVAHAAGEQ